MSKLAFDYSKWDRVEDSDDEDTHYPGFDRALNIRVNRLDRERKEEELDELKEDLCARGEYEKAEALEQKRPIHVGNACHVTEDRTIISSVGDSASTGATKEFKTEEYLQFKADNARILDCFEKANWERSHELLVEHGGVLLSEYANSYFSLTALDEEMAGNRLRSERLCFQNEIISQIQRIAVPARRPPRDMVPGFYKKFKDVPDEAWAAFRTGVDDFTRKLQNRAKQKAEEEEEERRRKAQAPQQRMEKRPLVQAMYSMTKEERVGPGGFDPVEVLESLPQGLQEAFRCGDIEMLKAAAEDMTEEEFDQHFQRCVDSGLWSQAS
mmetsp:Transcript_107542/g.302730  ORF Transcript_107542/g.302730 Transcript_107542/m.302730 type:complete len:326 (+) Transcript_107542:78-1055(+)